MKFRDFSGLGSDPSTEPSSILETTCFEQTASFWIKKNQGKKNQSRREEPTLNPADLCPGHGVHFSVRTFFVLLALMLAGCSENNTGSSDPDQGTSDSDTDNDVEADTDTDTDTDIDTDTECVEQGVCEEQFCDQVLIPAGVFTMGTDLGPNDEQPAHLVALDEFYIDKYEVTYERFLRCVQAECCDPAGIPSPDGWVIPPDTVMVNHYPPNCDDDFSLCFHIAVNCKNYQQAETYCEWIGRRLCTEAEWERAASGPGPEKPLYPWGDNPPTVELTNAYFYEYNAYIDDVDAHPSGASAEEVFDLAGNVTEWVADYYGLYAFAPDGGILENPTGPTDGDLAVGRGGCFLSPVDGNYPEYEELMITSRIPDMPESNVG